VSDNTAEHKQELSLATVWTSKENYLYDNTTKE
jgi:hypothetical protein